MTPPNEEWWAKARQARDKLAAQILSHPNVSMIDIGKDDTGVSDTPVLRIHVRATDLSGLNIPNDVDGIPVRVIRGDYRLQDHEAHH
jgi:hypothetical protein